MLGDPSLGRGLRGRGMGGVLTSAATKAPGEGAGVGWYCVGPTITFRDLKGNVLQANPGTNKHLCLQQWLCFSLESYPPPSLWRPPGSRGEIVGVPSGLQASVPIAKLSLHMARFFVEFQL